MAKTIRDIVNVTTGEVYIQARDTTATHLFDPKRALDDHIKWADKCYNKHNPDCYLAKWTMHAVNRGDALTIIFPSDPDTRNLSDSIANAMKKVRRNMWTGLGYKVTNKR